MNKDKKGFLVSLVIGDGHLRLTKNGDGTTNKSTAQLGLLHSTSQLKYLEWKRDRLVSCLGGNHPKISIRSIFNKTTNKSYGRCELNKSHRYFRVLHRWFYPNGKKTITKKLLKYLTAEGIAVWMLDDGCLKQSYNKQGQPTSMQFYLATYVSKEEAIDIQEYFSEQWGINFKIYKSKDKYMHYANKESAMKLCDLIRPYTIPSMEYKLYNILPRMQESI